MISVAVLFIIHDLLIPIAIFGDGIRISGRQQFIHKR